MKLKEIRELLKSGKPIQMQVPPNGWILLHEDEFIYFDSPASNYRTLSEPTYREWKPEEVPVGIPLRWKTGPVEPFALQSVKDGKASFITPNAGIQWQQIGFFFEYAECSYDHNATWVPCGVKEG